MSCPSLSQKITSYVQINLNLKSHNQRKKGFNSFKLSFYGEKYFKFKFLRLKDAFKNRSKDEKNVISYLKKNFILTIEDNDALELISTRNVLLRFGLFVCLTSVRNSILVTYGIL